jgi:choline kinase
MVEIGGTPLGQRALSSLRAAGATEVVAVTGHYPDALDTLGDFVSERRFNPRFADAGNIYSLWCARDVVETGCYVINSDVLFEAEIARRLVALEGTALLCAASHGVDRESMKAVSKDGWLERLSKEVPVDSNPEYIGLARIDPADGPLLARILDRFVTDDAVDAYYEAAIEQLAARRRVWIARVDGLAWIEIDDHDDLARAREEVLEHVA